MYTKKNSSISAGCLFPIIILVVICSYYIQEWRRSYQEYLSNLNYNNPVRTYKYTNDLFDEIDNNKVRFKRDVEGEIIRVIGYIDENFVQDDYFVVEGYGTLIPPRVGCYPRKELKANLADLNVGQTVMITGVVDYEDSMWDTVDLRHCVFTTNVNQRGSSDLSDILKIFKY